jgi:ABC-type multidrug transport system fused ATPase/permease subunit
MNPGGSISVGDLIKYQLYYNMMTTSIQQLTGVMNQFTRAAGAAERVLSLLDCKPDIDPFSGAPVDVAVRKWDLRFENVTFMYQMRPKNIVLQNLSFGVDEGSVAALVGKSGGGKSTIIHLILRFYDPVEGRITLGGVDFSQLNLRTVHHRIGVVSQATCRPVDERPPLSTTS